MTPQQREAALRLVDIALKHSADSDSDISEETALLRELASEPVQEPVAWRSKERINGEFDSGWKLTSTEPPQTPRTIAIEPLYTHPPQQRKPLSDEQIYAAISDQVFWATSKNFIVRVVRDVEAAHGITGGKE